MNQEIQGSDDPVTLPVVETLTVHLIEPASDALAREAGASDLSRTDVVNRALVVYAHLSELTRGGGTLLVRDATGQLSTLSFH